MCLTTPPKLNQPKNQLQLQPLPQKASLAQDASLTVEPLTGAQVNHTCRVRSSDGAQSCVVKVFLGNVKCLGPDAPIEASRCQRENDACHYFLSLTPNCCQLPYFCDAANSLVCLQDFPDHRLWGDVLLRSCDLHTGAKIADTLVALHSSSHREKLGVAEFQGLQQKFGPLPQQTAYLCDQHFNRPFLEGHRNNRPRDEDVRLKMDEVIKDDVVIKATELAKEWMAVASGDCCIHGDLHAGSILYKETDGSIKLIDTESSRIGPPAFDLALLICNYVLLYHYHQDMCHVVPAPDKTDHSQLMTDTLDLICITMSRYMEGMSRALQDKWDKHGVWRQILLMLGVEIIAWISGSQSFDSLELQPRAQLNCLNTALRIIHKQSLSLDTKGLSRLINNQH
ncbi:methylthioribose kinase-like [Physella acuta]|uniref:methylthioribose kinase-like n=1 Tax=Physella acuta TaxID=109671 RepID=UPI0027DBBEE9|nr:methylthioribose kinase-like [Physella acuta]